LKLNNHEDEHPHPCWSCLPPSTEVRMDITQIWMSQRKLRRAGQISAMVEALKQGEELPRIALVRSDDGEIQVHDGHHRLTAFWLLAAVWK
jgi:hypothetical protein